MAAPDIATIVSNLNDNADFEESGSVTKAHAFVTAAKRFLLFSPQTQSDEGSTLTMSVTQIENMMNQARNFITANSTASGAAKVRFLSASQGFRR